MIGASSEPVLVHGKEERKYPLTYGSYGCNFFCKKAPSPDPLLGASVRGFFRQESIMQTDRSLVAFDCDGVIFDHIGEDFLCAYNALRAVSPHTVVPGLPPRNLFLDDICEVRHENILFAKFRSLARFASRAEDYFTVLDLTLREDSELLLYMGEEEFDLARQGRLDLYPQFKEEFYKARNILQQEAPSGWARIVPMYPGVLEAISGLASRPNTTVVAATGRDRESTERLLAYNQIDDLFEYIASREDGDTRLEQLEHLSRLTDIPLTHVVFVNDRLPHLLNVEGSCIPVLADWGLTPPQDILSARESGLDVVRLTTLYQQVDSLLVRLTV
jgi:phosphoglycolate phosphatase-like HAD superfamily hydrolase